MTEKEKINSLCNLFDSMNAIVGEKHSVSISAHDFSPKTVAELQGGWKVEVNNSGNRTYFSAKRNDKSFDVTLFSSDVPLANPEGEKEENANS